MSFCFSTCLSQVIYTLDVNSDALFLKPISDVFASVSALNIWNKFPSRNKAISNPFLGILPNLSDNRNELELIGE